jgi:hypothetical protein
MGVVDIKIVQGLNLPSKTFTSRRGFANALKTKHKKICLPEDIGGIWSYQHFLSVLKNKNHPEYAESLEQLEWLGGSFDPEEFDLAEINEGLADLITNDV